MANYLGSIANTADGIFHDFMAMRQYKDNRDEKASALARQQMLDDRDESRYQDGISRYEDEKNYNREWDSKKWDHTLSRENRADFESDRNFGLNKQKASTAIANAAAANNRAQELHDLQMRQAERQQQIAQYKEPYDMAVQAYANGDIDSAKKFLSAIPENLQGYMGHMVNDYDYGSKFVNIYDKTINDLNTDNKGNPASLSNYQLREKINNSPDIMDNINFLLNPSIKTIIGEKGRDGSEIKDVKIAKIGGVPNKDTPNDLDPNKFTFLLDITTKNGLKYRAPITELRSSLPLDKIKVFDVGDVFKFIGDKAQAFYKYNTITKNYYGRNNKPQQLPQGALSALSSMYSTNLKALAGDGNATPEQMAQAQQMSLQQLQQLTGNSSPGSLASTAAKMQSAPPQQIAEIIETDPFAKDLYNASTEDERIKYKSDPEIFMKALKQYKEKQGDFSDSSLYKNIMQQRNLEQKELNRFKH